MIYIFVIIILIILALSSQFIIGSGWDVIREGSVDLFNTPLKDKCEDVGGRTETNEYQCIKKAVERDYQHLFRIDVTKLEELFKMYGINTFPDKYWIDASREVYDNPDRYFHTSHTLINSVSDLPYNYVCVNAALSNLLNGGSCIVSAVPYYNEYNNELQSMSQSVKNVAARYEARPGKFVLDIRGKAANYQGVNEYLHNEYARLENLNDFTVLCISAYDDKEEEGEQKINSMQYIPTNHLTFAYINHNTSTIYQFDPHGETSDLLSEFVQKILNPLIVKGYKYRRCDEMEIEGIQENEYDYGYCTMWSSMISYILYVNEEKDPSMIIAAIMGMDKQAVALLLSIFTKFLLDTYEDAHITDNYKMVENILDIEIDKAMANVNKYVSMIEDKYSKSSVASEVLEDIKRIRSTRLSETLIDKFMRFKYLPGLSAILQSFIEKGIFYPPNKNMLFWLKGVSKEERNCVYL